METKKVNELEKINTKDKIIYAAIDLFSSNGYSAVSVRDITRAAGIKESSLYNHFKSKDELLEVIFNMFMESVGKTSFREEEIDELLPGLEPEVFLQHHVLHFREKLTPAMEKIWRIIYLEQFRDKRARDFVVNEIIGRAEAFYEKAFRAIAENYGNKSADPALIAASCNYSLLALSMERMLLQTDNLDTAPVTKKIFDQIKFLCNIVKMH